MAAILVGMGRGREGGGVYYTSYMLESSFTPLISRDGRTNNTENALETEITRNESQVKQCVLQLTHYMIACENSHPFSLLQLAAGETSPAVSG